MPTCSFCKKSYNFPQGLTIFTFEGKSVHYCSSKCRRNAALRRDPKKTSWVKKEKKMTKSEKEAERLQYIENKAAEEEKIEKKAPESKEKKK